MTTTDAYQADLAPGLPAYAPAAKAWLAGQQKSGYFADDIAPAVQQAAGQVWPGWGYGKFSQEAIWAATVTPGLTAGKTIVSMLPAWQTAITNYATRRRLPGHPLTPATTGPARARARRAPWRAVRAGHAFVAGYVVLLVAFGVVPAVYAHLLRVHQRGQQLHRTVQLHAVRPGLPVRARASSTSALYLVIWLVALVVLVTGLALVLHQLPRAAASAGWCASCTTFPARWPGPPASWCGCSCSTRPSARRPRSCACSATAPSARSSRPGTCRSCSR